MHDVISLQARRYRQVIEMYARILLLQQNMKPVQFNSKFHILYISLRCKSYVVSVLDIKDVNCKTITNFWINIRINEP